MANKHNNTRHLNIALLGGDHFTRQGIAALLKNIAPDMQINASSNDYAELEKMLTATPVDVIFLSGTDKYHAGYDCLKYIKKMKVLYPGVLICMYSAPANSWLWIRGEIDAYISLQDPLYHWRASVLKLVDSRYRPIKKPTALSLTPGEWRVLKELRKGLDMRYIAETEQLSYRRVSALKSSAIRKLGLRNKTDLLVFLTS
ncbi:LuxR C-terminal-related transcriptional regulator [Enterobacter asburiae]|jgi:two-component system response regulator FimZ (fimbrial Z protein)|uniref:helix-turn-helix transcriptional regulator n=1 Tax=Enterobacter TaxID=547 RepID=UPI000EB06214|nr:MULTISPECIES: LuxR C-terminal-related transcriptional regulator [Enterobacter]EHN8922950.1 response regulator transcription factor [Enterobacter asburiae]ELH8608731.1 response regulator transcription factor [Enterobacter asburiae]EMD2767139.1 response regulator transcription factor [Enterobacter asburiae]MBE8908073.1 response regulator transcription factor [Enterobacter asburiae]MBS7444353.1 response regulator transcription factor [Enterobacter sp. 120016]